MSKFVDSIIGHAVGDAMGVPVEFCIRERLLNHPVTKMIGYGSHDVPAGTWSDDTSMELALLDSFINNKGWNYDDIMKNFVNWVSKGEYTPNGEVFDIGNTCYQAILRYTNGVPALECGLEEEYDNGNGSLMRILPVAFYAFQIGLSKNQIYKLVKDVSSLTHRNEISILGCYIYTNYVIELLNGIDKEEAYKKIKKYRYSNLFSEYAIHEYDCIIKDNVKELNINEVKSSGFIVDTLEAVLWCVLNTDNYRSAIIKAINLGDDADTIGAITGSMAGIIYGIDSIPEDWLNTLKKKDYLMSLALEFEKKVNE